MAENGLDQPVESSAVENPESGETAAWKTDCDGETKAEGRDTASPVLANGTDDPNGDEFPSEDDKEIVKEEPVAVKKRSMTKKMMEKALYLCDEDDDEPPEKLSFEGTTPEIGGRAKWLERQRDRESKNKRLSKTKDGTFFSYMFLEKIFRESRKCKLCGAKDSGKPQTDDESSLELYLSERGVVGRQRLLCSTCNGVFPVVSCDAETEIPDKPEYQIDGSTVRYYCKKAMHFGVLHDLMELLHIAALESEKSRKQKHVELAEFMLHNARKVCKEWCRPENGDLRAKRFLRLREDTLLIRHNPIFTIDHNAEYKEMYGMMAGSFRQHREKVKLLLELLKTTLFDNPTQSSFFLWVAIAMIHAESYQKFKERYDPKSYMQIDSTDYQAMKDRYLAMHVALGVKKIPICFILFELPRFYHYIDFLKERVGKERPTTFLTVDDQRTLEKFDRQAHKYMMKRRLKSGKLVSVESHLDMIMAQEEIDKEQMFRNTKEKGRAKAEDKKRQRKQRREERQKRGVAVKELQDDNRASSDGKIVEEISESLGDLERKRLERKERMPYPPFRQRVLGPMRERTSLETDMVADMTLRKPYKSRFDLLLEEDDRQWGLEGNWSRKDILLCEEDMMFERKVCIRFKKPEKRYSETIPSFLDLPPPSGRMPMQAEVQLLMDRVLALEMDPISFDGACSSVTESQIKRWKKEEEEPTTQTNSKEEGSGGGKDGGEKEGELAKPNEGGGKGAESEDEEEREGGKDGGKKERESTGANEGVEKKGDVARSVEMESNEGEGKDTSNGESAEANERGENEGTEINQGEEGNSDMEVGSETKEVATISPELVLNPPERTAESVLEENPKPQEPTTSDKVSESVHATEDSLKPSDDNAPTTPPPTAIVEKTESIITAEEIAIPQAREIAAENNIITPTEERETAPAEESSIAPAEGKEEKEPADENSLTPAEVEEVVNTEPMVGEDEQGKEVGLNVEENDTKSTENHEPTQEKPDPVPIAKQEKECEEKEEEEGEKDNQPIGEDLDRGSNSEQEDKPANVSGTGEDDSKADRSRLSNDKDDSELDHNKHKEEEEDEKETIHREVAEDMPQEIQQAQKDLEEREMGKDHIDPPTEDPEPLEGIANSVRTVAMEDEDQPITFTAPETAPDLPPTLAENTPEPLPDKDSSSEKTENEGENETKPELAGSTATSNTSADPSESAANEDHIEVEEEEKKENVEDEKPAKEESKKEKKVSKKRSKKMEKKAKQLVEAVQRRKAIEEKYFQHRLLKRTPSEEAFEKLMEKKDCTLAELTPEEKQVLMDHCHRRKKRDPIDEEWDRTMFARRKPKGPAFVRSRLRQKLQERQKDDDDDYLYSRAYKRREPTPERPKTPEYTPLKSSDSPKAAKRKSKRAKAGENEEVNGTQEPLVPDAEKMNEVKEKLNKLGMEACMPKTEAMKSKVADAKMEDESKLLEDTNHSPSESTTDSSGVLTVTIPKQQSETDSERRLVSPDEFHSLLVDHLKANREAEERNTETPPPTTPPRIQATEQEKQPESSEALPELENGVIGEQPEERKTSPPNDLEGEEEEAGADEKVSQLEEDREAERREKKRRRKNEKKKAIRQKKEEEQQAEQEKARLEQERAKIELEKAKAELERVKAEQESELTGRAAPEKKKPEPKKKSVRGPTVPLRLQFHNRRKPKNPEFNPKDYTEHQPLETLGMIPLMLTKAPCYITLDDMMSVESDKDDENSSPGCFVYRTSVENGGKEHPFVDIYLFARKRREDLDIIVEVSPIKAYRNHEDVLCLAGKPGRISYSCKLEISQLWTPVGE